MIDKRKKEVEEAFHTAILGILEICISVYVQNTNDDDKKIEQIAKQIRNLHIV